MSRTSEGHYATTTDRLIAVLDHLGIGRAHVATQIPADIGGLATAHPDRIGGVVLCAPVRLDPARFAAVADRVLMVSGEYGPTFEVTLRAEARLPGAARYVLDSYEAHGWSDVAADRAQELAGRMASFLRPLAADAPRAGAAEASHAGISYRVEGSGPALVLLPFFLAASQWAPAIPHLARDFTVISAGGRHLGGIAALEARASMPRYQAMFRSLIRQNGPPPQSVAGNGVADASLYRRMRRAGLADLRCFAFLVTLDRPNGPIWRYREDHVLSLLSGEELPVWQEARAKAEQDGLLMMAHPLHCAVGRKPAG